MIDTVRWLDARGRILDCVPEDRSGLIPGRLRIIDQRLLPERLEYIQIDDIEEVFSAIKRLSVRGAPAIGCAAALGLASAMCKEHARSRRDFMKKLLASADRLNASRPTAVNLSWALNRCVDKMRALCAEEKDVKALSEALVEEALAILAEDIAMCRAIGEQGASLVTEGCGILTHCNAGALAAGDFGTALSPLYSAHEKGVGFTVYTDETRPLLQGSRLSAWELRRAGIRVVLICDNMAASVMREGKIGLVIVGADRIAANGDAANKIGSYGLAILAKRHDIPFYVAAPYSTIDMSIEDGALIPIELRPPEELTIINGKKLAPDDVEIYNPAFDVIDSELISGIITEAGVLYPPFKSSIKRFMAARRANGAPA